jgi:hypothetical protein
VLPTEPFEDRTPSTDPSTLIVSVSVSFMDDSSDDCHSFTGLLSPSSFCSAPATASVPAVSVENIDFTAADSAAVSVENMEVTPPDDEALSAAAAAAAMRCRALSSWVVSPWVVSETAVSVADSEMDTDSEPGVPELLPKGTWDRQVLHKCNP